jgi:peroxiredoxin
MGGMPMSAKPSFERAILITLFVTFAIDQPTDLQASRFNRKVDVGSAAPVWMGLPGTDGKTHSLKDWEAAKLLVIAFTSSSCPVSQLYEDRFMKFAREHGPRGVAFVAISCSLLPADRLDQIRQRAREKHFNFATLMDLSQQTGRDYGATVTPQLFVLDRERKIAYMGKFDDNIEPEKVRRKYVEDAVRALLAGRRPEPSETRATGCGIEYGVRP